MGEASQIIGVEGSIWVARYDFLQRMNDDVGLGGEALKAMAANPRYAESIEYWKQEGVIDAQWNVNQGQMVDKMEDFQVALIESRTLQPMTPEQQITYKDGYSAAVGKVVDPKLVKIEDMGDGVKRTTILNADGKTPAASFLTGSFTLKNGQTMDNVTLSGTSRRDWSKYQETLDRTGSLFSDAINGGSEEEKSKDLPPGYKGASLDPRTIEGYEAGLSYMGGFGGGVAPLSAENAARAAQGLQQIGPKSGWAEVPKEEHVPQGSGLPGGLANLPSPGEMKNDSGFGGGTGGKGKAYIADAEASFGSGGGQMASLSNNAFAEQLKKVGG